MERVLGGDQGDGELLLVGNVQAHRGQTLQVGNGGAQGTLGSGKGLLGSLGDEFVGGVAGGQDLDGLRQHGGVFRDDLDGFVGVGETFAGDGVGNQAEL